MLRSLNITQINVLEPLQKKYPNNTKITLPYSLKPIKQIPLENLIFELENTQSISLDGNEWPDWVYFCMGLVIATVIILCIFLWKKYGSKIKQTCSSLGGNRQLQGVVDTKPVSQSGVSTRVDGQTSTCDDHIPSNLRYVLRIRTIIR